MTDHQFLLQRVQPAMIGLIDGSLSTLAPIFAIVLHTHNPFDAFIAGVATAFGAGISMAFSEGLSDTGELTGRGSPLMRGAITGVGTFIGGILHTLPFLIPHYQAAIFSAIAVVALELLILAWLRWLGVVRRMARLLGELVDMPVGSAEVRPTVAVLRALDLVEELDPPLHQLGPRRFEVVNEEVGHRSDHEALVARPCTEYLEPVA